eukprot:jgi/Mesen1/2856/ME000174S02106
MACSVQILGQLSPYCAFKLGKVQTSTSGVLSSSSSSQCLRMSHPRKQGKTTLKQQSRKIQVTRASGEKGSGSCCGGSEGSGNSGSGCSSHSAPAPTNTGRSFDSMLAAATMAELEKDYNKGEMQGTITRDVINDVVQTVPELLPLGTESGEKFLDIDELLSQANEMAEGDDFIFSLEDMMV